MKISICASSIPEYNLQINETLMNKTFHFGQEDMQEKCAAEKAYEIGAKVEKSPSKSWTNLYNRCADIIIIIIITTTTTTTNATKLQHLHPYKTTMINKTYTADTDVELNFKNWYPELWVGRGGTYCRN